MKNWYIVQTFSGFEQKVAETLKETIKKKELENQNTENSKSEIGWGHQIRSYVLQPYLSLIHI